MLDDAWLDHASLDWFFARVLAPHGREFAKGGDTLLDVGGKGAGFDQRCFVSAGNLMSIGSAGFAMTWRSAQ